MRKDVKQLIKDKGFYVALAVCLVAVGVVAVISLSRMLPPAEEGETTPTTTGTPTTTAQGVQNPVTNIPDLRTTTAAPTTRPTAAPTDTPKPQDLYVLPLTNEVSKAFSPNEPLYSETMKDWRTHSGVDFTGEKGQTVKAAAAGKITAIKTDVMWGGLIEIDHGFGIVTRYCGVSARDIAVGDVVEVGEPIGVLTTVPCEAEEGEHLHFEVLSSGKPLDAVAVIGVDVRYKE
ncbi:MAG: M23 family metallopeptidase [Clostridia bacterium]|nr:M23 family metallopeptidase [Clostridia bacterium]